MNNINIKELVNDNVNIVELYFVNKKLDNNVINVMMSRDIENKIDKLYKKTKEENYKMYYMKDKVYTYELSNDNQYVTSKTKKLDTFYKTKKSNIYIISSKIDKYPQYVFPCTNDIDNISEINIKEYKISNRVSLIIKNEVLDNIKTLLIEYKHSTNVEMDKITEIVNKLVKNIEVILNNEDI
jgi:hypothetical protein